MQAVTELRSEFEKKSIDYGKIDKIDNFLDAQEKHNQTLVSDKKASEKRGSEMKDRMDALEVELSRSGGPGSEKNYKDASEYKALAHYCQQGNSNMDRDQKALLRTDSDVVGGYLTTTELDSELIRKIVEISPIRSVARVRSISTKAIEMAVRNTILTATFEGEAEPDEQSTSTYSNETLNTFRQSVTVPVTVDLLMSSTFDVESEIMTDASIAQAEGEGRNFVLGDGVKKPLGFTADPRVTADAFDTSTSSTVTAADVINITGELKTGYNPMYFFNRKTLAFLRTLIGTDQHFLWQPGLNGPVANTLNGFDYMITPDMPDIADNAFPIAFADLRRGYTIVDRNGTGVIRDEITGASDATIKFTIRRWLYGQVTLPEAIKLLKVIP